jgi:hypothetical protein
VVGGGVPGSGEGGCNVTDGDGAADGDAEGSGDADADGLRCGDDAGAADVNDRVGLDVVAAADEDGNKDEEATLLGAGLRADGCSETRCTAATELAVVPAPGPLTAKAAPAVAVTATAPTAMAARSPVIRRNRSARTAGGAPADGHRAVSSIAASPRCVLPRSCQSRP